MATISELRGAATQEMSSSHPYTCNTCQVAFRNSDLQKGHMRSDWHRYNLQRRVACLPPISSEIFTEKALQARASSTLEAERAGFQKECTACHRTYYSENSYQNHIGSQKHKTKEAACIRVGRKDGAAVIADDVSSMRSTFSLGEPVKSDVDSDVPENDNVNEIVECMNNARIQDQSSKQQSTDGDRQMTEELSQLPSSSATFVPFKIAGSTPNVSLISCLFCNLDSVDIQMNVIHMERTHGMFIPEKQYLVDLEGLLGSLQQRIQDFHECLVCGKVKANAFAAQTHMRDTGHCKIPYTTEDEQLEIGEFYDFRSTYSDDEDCDSDDDSAEANGGARLGTSRTITVTNENGEEIAGGRDEGWETDSSASSLDSADLTAVPAEHHYHQYERLEKHPHHSRQDARPHHQGDGLWHSHSHKPTRAVFYDEYELHLPSGKSVGHRSLNRYFRQNLHNRPTPVERAQLALEECWLDSDDSEAMDAGDDEEQEGGNRQQLVHYRSARDQVRQLMGRDEGGSGMQGVSERKRREVRRAEVRGRRVETAANRRKEWSVNKGANNQKYYHYSIL